MAIHIPTIQGGNITIITPPRGKVLYKTSADGDWLQSDADITNGTFNGFTEKFSAVAVMLPSKDAEGNDVTNIGMRALWNASGLTSITIPNSVTGIGIQAFQRCTNLTNVTIPDSVESIGDSAFSGCSGLTSVTIPDSVTNIGDDAFEYCSGLTSVVIGDGVTSIGNGAFRGCSSLLSILVDSGNANYKSVNSLLLSKDGTTLIQGVNGDVVIPNSVTNIGPYAFYECHDLTSVVIPDGVTSIGNSAFSYCSGLTSVTIPDSVTNIGDDAFGWSTGLTNMTIPDSVTSIGDGAFYRCSGLTIVTIVATGKSGASAENVKQKVITAISNTSISDNITWNMPS